jgi:hypothetical protein
VVGKLGITSRRQLRWVSPDGWPLRRRSSFSRSHPRSDRDQITQLTVMPQ